MNTRESPPGELGAGDDWRVSTDIQALVAQAPGLVLLLDYDGTLVEIATRPEYAVPDAALVRLLRQLAARPASAVSLVSGRPRPTLCAWFAAAGVGLWAEHGAFYDRAGEGKWRCMLQTVPRDGWAEPALRLMARAVEHVPGSFIERKALALAWHYRQADPAEAHACGEELKAALSSLEAAAGLEVLQGKKVIELRPRGVSKALAVRHAAARHPGWVTVAIGDDRTDEDMFCALSAGDISVAVGGGACGARFRLSGPAAVRALLQRLLE